MSIATVSSTVAPQTQKWRAPANALALKLRRAATQGQPVPATTVAAWADELDSLLQLDASGAALGTPVSSDGDSLFKSQRQRQQQCILGAHPSAPHRPTTATASRSASVAAHTKAPLRPTTSVGRRRRSPNSSVNNSINVPPLKGSVEPKKSFPHCRDIGRLEEKFISSQVSTTTTNAASSHAPELALCIYAVLESILWETKCDSIVLFVPHRGLQDEFRCVCKITRDGRPFHRGSAILRGTHTLEYACQMSGLLLNVGPRAVLSEYGTSAACLSFLELLEKPDTTLSEVLNHSVPSYVFTKSHGEEKEKGKRKEDDLCRLCCPIIPSSASAPQGVLTLATRGDGHFGTDHENFVYDAAIIIGLLLERCEDYALLEQCFARGGIRCYMPPSRVPRQPNIPEQREQLVYRVSVASADVCEAVRVPLGGQGTHKLREGAPVSSVFKHMRKLQESWSSAVKLNVELGRLCDEKEEYIATLLSRARLLEKASATAATRCTPTLQEA